MQTTRALLVILLLVLTMLGGMLAADVPSGEHPSGEADDAPDESPGGGRGEGRGKQDPYYVEHEMYGVFTDVSSGPHEVPLDLEDDAAMVFCFDDGLYEIRATLEWGPDRPLSDIQFGLLFPSEPPLVSGPSELVWEHTLSEEDADACAELVIRADPSDVNIHLGQKVYLVVSLAYNGPFP